MAKSKYFDGTLQFDFYGRISDSDTVRRMDITKEQTDGIYLLIPDFSSYDPVTQKYKYMRSNLTLSDLKVGPPMSANPDCVASIDSHFECPNIPFDDEMVYRGYYAGRYSASMEVTSNLTGRTYRVFMKDFDEYVPRMVNGIVKGKFIFRKRGYKFGLVLLK